MIIFLQRDYFIDNMLKTHIGASTILSYEDVDGK